MLEFSCVTHFASTRFSLGLVLQTYPYLVAPAGPVLAVWFGVYRCFEFGGRDQNDSVDSN